MHYSIFIHFSSSLFGHRSPHCFSKSRNNHFSPYLHSHKIYKWYRSVWHTLHIHRYIFLACSSLFLMFEIHVRAATFDPITIQTGSEHDAFFRRGFEIMKIFSFEVHRVQHSQLKFCSRDTCMPLFTYRSILG